MYLATAQQRHENSIFIIFSNRHTNKLGKSTLSSESHSLNLPWKKKLFFSFIFKIVVTMHTILVIHFVNLFFLWFLND